MKNGGMDFRVTKNISFHDIYSKRIAPVDVYLAQVNEWLLNPGRRLMEPFNSDNGMALLSIELLFFEPHAQYLNGYSSNGQSRVFFEHAFKRFIDFLTSKHLMKIGNKPEPDKLYKWLRCGLFHSSTVSNEILVDAQRIGKSSIYKNPRAEGWLLNPWVLLDQIDLYVKDYVQEIKDYPESELSKNFLKTFDRLVGGAIRKHVDSDYHSAGIYRS